MGIARPKSRSEKRMAPKMAEAPIVNAWSTKSTAPFFRVGNYAPVFDELTAFDLPVEGAIPASAQRLVFA
jgi:hypothetical protein